MYSIVYVIVDDENLNIYNEMMKSLMSLRMRMPDRPVKVLVDCDTYEYLKHTDAEVFQLAQVISVDILGDYSQIEKSRYIKTRARKIVSGDILYIDTDTVICEKFPDKISDTSIGLVLELHYPKSVAKSPYADIYDNICGIARTDFDLYYNSGVMWAKDDALAHEFYDKWYHKWEETRKSGLYRDQPSLNFVIRSMPQVVDTLDGCWNVQISTRVFAPLHLLTEALIIHYMDNNWSAYQLCRPEYKNRLYNDPVILEMLQRPKTLFDRCRVHRLDEDNHYAEGELREYELLKDSLQYRFLQAIRRRPRLHAVNEKTLGVLYRLFKRKG